MQDVLSDIRNNYAAIESLLKVSYPSEKNLASDKKNVELLKNYLDSLKVFQKTVKPLLGSGMEASKDAAFYGQFEVDWQILDLVTPLYNRVRNYMTQKPYSVEKFKLNFGNGTLLNGWDVNKEKDNYGVILRKDGKYYLCILHDKKAFDKVPTTNGSDCWEKMEYKLLPGPNKMLPKVFFSKSRISEFNPSDALLRKYELGTHKKGDSFSLEDCHALIDFFKESIDKHEDWSKFDFHFSDTSSYKDISDFYKEISQQGYKISFRMIPNQYMEELVKSGRIYLFQIYNKDFSPRSKGMPNLHTLYWKMLFDEKNLQDVVYKLNGEAEVFYRKASIEPENIIVHKAGEVIERKNTHHQDAKSLFQYDITKDRRFTVDKFQFHVPITMNFKATDRFDINLAVRKGIQKQERHHVIGIDRGERHLLYLCVIDDTGKIVEKTTLNIIGDTDYHELLDRREAARDMGRKNWQSIESIKELKEGYLSQAIHQITEWMVKYDAIVVLEDLNLGFMRGRQKIEKQVYQKFEHMLIDKLNYLVDKKTPANEIGGLLHAYQLTNKFESFQKLGKQSGVLFYTQAWNTSKIDPVTGFVNLFDTRLSTIDEKIKFWKKFDAIRFDDDKGMFAFEFHYSNFTQKAVGARDHWTVWTNGMRIHNRRNDNGLWESQEVNLVEEMKQLFERNGLDYRNRDLKTIICEQKTGAFQEVLLWLFRMTLQMRNSKMGTDIDYITSPVLNADGVFYDSRFCEGGLPKDADANGAYNIARKGLMMIDRLKMTPEAELKKADLLIRSKDWLSFAQNQ